MNEELKDAVNVERTEYVTAVSSAHPGCPPIMPDRFNSTSAPVFGSLAVSGLSTTSTPRSEAKVKKKPASR